MSTILSATNLCKKYGKQLVLNNISFNIEDGDIIGLIGENGAGKSTLIDILAGINNADDGTVQLSDNISISECVKYYEKICVAFDQSPLYSHLSGINNLRLYSNDDNIILHFLKLCDLENAKDKKVSAYSLGMKQRLNIARTFLMWSKLMIMDEPINGLDPGIIIDIKKYIQDQCRAGRSVLISSHSLKELLFFCNKFILIHKGTIVAEIDSTKIHFEAFDKYADTSNPITLDWLKKNNIEYLEIPYLHRVYFSLDSKTTNGFIFSQIDAGTNILENIYLQMSNL